MTNKAAKRHAADQIRKVEAALRRWDPIGILPGEAGPADEYDSYAPHIVGLIQRGGSVAQLVAHLGRLRTETMGLPSDADLDEKTAEEIVRLLRQPN